MDASGDSRYNDAQAFICRRVHSLEFGMIQIIADAGVQSTLAGVVETVEVRGAQGELLGYFSPACPETARLYAEAAARLNPQELSRRRLAHEPALTTADVLDHLQALCDR
jgi:hypothetical protein